MPPSLIRAAGRDLIRDGQPWRFVLANAYFLQDEAGQGSPEHVIETLEAARALGLPVLRAWAFNDNPDKASRLHARPGEPHEPGLRALDFVLAEAGARGLRLILALSDYWPSYGGIAQWLRWHGAAPHEHARFFVDPLLRRAWAAHVAALLERVNTLTGVRYGDDPTVLAWELMNEPRAAPAEWIAFAAGVVRRHARQLLALGDEEAATPPGIDLATLHFYPQKHGAAAGTEEAFGLARIAAAAARVRDRPLLVTELGLRRDRLDLGTRRRAYRRWLAGALDAGVAAIGPWLLAYRARPPAWDEELTFHLGGEYDEVLREAAAAFAAAPPCSASGAGV